MPLTRATYYMIANGFANVRDYGAKGNGGDDDTAAFQAAANTGKTVFIPNGNYIISSPVVFSVSMFGEGAYEPRSVITLTNTGQLVVNDPYITWENFFVRSAVNNLAFIKCLHSGWTFNNFRLEKIGAATGQRGVLFDTTDRSIYFCSLENFKIKLDYPIRVTGNGTESFNANRIGASIRDYWQDFESAIYLEDALVYNANHFAGYFEVGTNVVNLINGKFSQNRLDLLLDAVTRSYNQAIGLTDVEHNFWTVKNDQFVWGGAYPKNQYYFGTESTKIRATNSVAQSILNASATVLTYNTEEFDTLSEFANGSGLFTPRNAGYYQVCAQSTSESAAWDATERWEIRVYKNGSNYASGEWNAADAAVTTQRSSSVNTLVYMNGTTDTLDVRVIHNQGASVNTSASAVQNYISISRT